MDSAVWDIVRDNPLTQAAMKATGLTLEELAAGITIYPNDEALTPSGWAMSWLAGLFPDNKRLDVHPLAVLLWFWSEGSMDHPDKRELASSYLVKEEYALAYADGVTTQKARSQGGESAGRERREEAQQRHNRIIERWHNLAHMPERNRATAIAERLGCTPKHVREVLRKANLR